MVIKPKYWFVIILFGISAAYSQGKTTNLEFVENAADSLVRQLVHLNPHLVTGPVCVINSGGRHDLNRLFESRLARLLQQLDVEEIYLHDCDTSSEISAVEYDVKEFRLEYSGGNPEYSPELYERRVRLNIAVQVMVYPQSRILWSDDLQIHESDLINKDEISELEDEGESFTVGQYVDTGKSGNILQPILVTTVTGVIVYLFFAIRSR